MTLRSRIDRLLTERVIMVAGWVLFLMYGYPGYMSYDSAFELSQARHIDKMNDWHPPVFSILWRHVDRLFAGPFPMLVIQSLVFMIGVRALLRRLLPGRAGAIVTVAILLAPPTIVIFGVIWKDALMAGCLVSGIVCLFSQNKWVRFTGYFFIFFATALRYNSAAATLPIVLFQFGWKSGIRRWRRFVLATVVWIGIAVAALLVNNHYIEEYKHPWQTSVAMFDITGIIRYAPKIDNDELLRDTVGVPWHKTDKIQIRCRTWYHPESTNFLSLVVEPGQIFEYPNGDADMAGLTHAWKTLVAKYPWAYVHHRLAVFDAQMKIDNNVVFSEFSDPVLLDLLGHRAIHSKWQKKWLNLMLDLEGTFVFRTNFYFLLALLLIPLCRRDRLSMILLSSGLVYEMGLLVAAPAIGFRYSQWLAECVMLVAVMTFVRRYRSTSRSDSDTARSSSAPHPARI